MPVYSWECSCGEQRHLVSHKPRLLSKLVVLCKQCGRKMNYLWWGGMLAGNLDNTPPSIVQRNKDADSVFRAHEDYQRGQRDWKYKVNRWRDKRDREAFAKGKKPSKL